MASEASGYSDGWDRVKVKMTHWILERQSDCAISQSCRSHSLALYTNTGVPSYRVWGCLLQQPDSTHTFSLP